MKQGAFVILAVAALVVFGINQFKTEWIQNPPQLLAGNLIGDDFLNFP